MTPLTSFQPEFCLADDHRQRAEKEGTFGATRGQPFLLVYKRKTCHLRSQLDRGLRGSCLHCCTSTPFHFCDEVDRLEQKMVSIFWDARTKENPKTKVENEQALRHLVHALRCESRYPGLWDRVPREGSVVLERQAHPGAGQKWLEVDAALYSSRKPDMSLRNTRR